MQEVKAKKYLGQHFLTDENTALRITEALDKKDRVLEIGAGMGVLTKYLIPAVNDFKVVEIDTESVQYLYSAYPSLSDKIIEGDFLKLSLSEVFNGEHFALIGNFPYNISNQILFKVFDNREIVDQVVGMFQKEVALRITAQKGSKTYGILSVLLDAFYERSYLFSVSNTLFNPPPAVQSAVITLKRKNDVTLGVNTEDFVRVVKAAFNHRRKMLRQSLKSLQKDLTDVDEKFLTLRPEQMDTQDFINLTRMIYHE